VRVLMRRPRREHLRSCDLDPSVLPRFLERREADLLILETLGLQE
jgi:hypothetical protein